MKIRVGDPARREALRAEEPTLFENGHSLLTNGKFYRIIKYEEAPTVGASFSRYQEITAMLVAGRLFLFVFYNFNDTSNQRKQQVTEKEKIFPFYHWHHLPLPRKAKRNLRASSKNQEAPPPDRRSNSSATKGCPIRILYHILTDLSKKIYCLEAKKPNFYLLLKSSGRASVKSVAIREYSPRRRAARSPQRP